jgi:hypothetical protein
VLIALNNEAFVGSVEMDTGGHTVGRFNILLSLY